MRKYQKRLGGAALVSGLVVVGVALGAAPASATTTFPEYRTTPGGSLEIYPSYSQTETGGSIYGTVTYTAPQGSTITSATAFNGGMASACHIEPDNLSASCGSDAYAQWQNAWWKITLTAPSTPGVYTGDQTVVNNGQVIENGSYTIKVAPEAPVVTGVGQSADSKTELSGTSTSDGTVEVKTADGTVVGTGTVVDGNFTVELDGDYSGEDLTVIVTSNNVPSDPTSVTVVPSPIVAPAIAGGAGLLAAALVGCSLVAQRKRATASA
jgi:hypothetical protein